MELKQYLACILIVVAFPLFSQEESKAESTKSDNVETQVHFIRVDNSNPETVITPDTFGDEIKLNHEEEKELVATYCDKNNVVFVSEATYLKMTPEEKRMVKNNAKFIVSNNPLEYIKKQKPLITK